MTGRGSRLMGWFDHVKDWPEWGLFLLGFLFVALVVYVPLVALLVVVNLLGWW